MCQPRLMISIVDDEAPVRKALGRLLRASGFDVETFSSGPEFLDSLRRHLPDCAILDLHLNGLSGLDVQQRLREENIRVPCIIITGKDEPGLDERVLASGAAGFLRKPLHDEALLAAINAAVPKSGNWGGQPDMGSSGTCSGLNGGHLTNGGK